MSRQLTPSSSSLCTITKLSCAVFSVREFVIVLPFCCGVCGLCRLVKESAGSSAFIACEVALGVSGGDLDIVRIIERDRVHV